MNSAFDSVLNATQPIKNLTMNSTLDSVLNATQPIKNSTMNSTLDSVLNGTSENSVKNLIQMNNDKLQKFISFKTKQSTKDNKSNNDMIINIKDKDDIESQ